MTREGGVDITILAMGEVDPHRVAYIERMLGAEGLTTTVMVCPNPKSTLGVEASNTSDILEAPHDRLYDLSDITSAGDFLVREHFMDYRARYMPTVNKASVGRALSTLLSPSIRHSQYHPVYPRFIREELNPADLGLIIRKRKDIGLPAASTQSFLIDAIQLDGFLKYIERDDPRARQLFGMTEERLNFLRAFAAHLRVQIEQTVAS